MVPEEPNYIIAIRTVVYCVHHHRSEVQRL